jgi:hypothetical protein
MKLFTCDSTLGQKKSPLCEFVEYKNVRWMGEKLIYQIEGEEKEISMPLSAVALM